MIPIHSFTPFIDNDISIQTLWQVLDGLLFAFPKELEARKKDYTLLFEKFYPNFKEEKGIKDYLSSDRRLPYSMGLYRKYPELDRQ